MTVPTLANVGGRSALVDAEGSAVDLASAAGDDALADPMVAIARLGTLDVDALLDGDVRLGALDDLGLRCPVPRPRDVFAIGLNYRDHAAEGNMELPENPLVFTKFPSCLADPDADVVLRGRAVDYEGELVVVIGTGGRDIAADDAWDHVAGVTIGQDISDRAVQFAATPPHFDLGKSFDTYGPIGPVIVAPTETLITEGLRLRTSVNGEVRQDDTTASLIFDVPTLIAYLSAVCTLAPGDLIFTGTPSGVGAVDGRFLTDGDVIETTIDGIGTIRNRCRSATT